MKNQKVVKYKILDITIKIIDKYAQMNRFQHDHWLQVYICALMYVANDKMEEED